MLKDVCSSLSLLFAVAEFSCGFGDAEMAVVRLLAQGEVESH